MHDKIAVQFDPELARRLRVDFAALGDAELAHLAGFCLAKLAEYQDDGEAVHCDRLLAAATDLAPKMAALFVKLLDDVDAEAATVEGHA